MTLVLVVVASPLYFGDLALKNMGTHNLIQSNKREFLCYI
jgi:hypothetical protein